MEQTLIESFQSGISEFLKSVDWIYVIVFMVISWLLNDYGDANNKGRWLNWYAKIPKTLRTLLFGIILIGVFAYFWRYQTRDEIFELVLSMIFTMVLYKIGFDKIFGWVSSSVLKIKKTE